MQFVFQFISMFGAGNYDYGFRFCRNSKLENQFVNCQARNFRILNGVVNERLTNKNNL